MARVRFIQRGNQAVSPHPTEVDLFVQTLTSTDGTVLLHLTTMGSTDRQSPPKTSQTLQLDVESSRALIEEMLMAFGPSALPQDQPD